MRGFQGADTEQLRAQARQLDSAALRLEEMGTTLASSIATLGWEGTDAAVFREVGSMVLLRLRSELGTGLRGHAARLVEDADDQDMASDPDPLEAEQMLGDGGFPLPHRGFGTAVPMGSPATPVSVSAPILPEEDWPPPTAAERDQRDLMDAFLPVGQNLHAEQTESDIETISGTVRFGDTLGTLGDAQFGGTRVTAFGEVSHTTSIVDEGYELPDGTTVWVMSTSETTTESVGLEGEAGLGGRFGLHGETSRGEYESTTTYQEVTVPPGVDLPESFNPHDPSTYPAGVQVRFDDAWVTGTESNVSGGGTYQGFGLDLGFSESSGDGSGESVIYERLDNGDVRVTQGPTEGMIESRGYAASFSVPGASVGLDLTGSDASRSYEYESAAFDLESDSGSAAYDGFRETGVFPDHRTEGTSDHQRVTVENQWREEASGLVFDLNGAHGGGSATATTELALRDNSTGFDSTITVEYLRDGSSRTLETSSENPSTGVYAATETWHAADGAAATENYLSLPADEDQFVMYGTAPIPEQIEQDYGTPVEPGDRVEIHYTDSELDHMWEIQEQFVRTDDAREAPGDVLHIIQRQNTAGSPTELLTHLRGLEHAHQGTLEGTDPIVDMPGTARVRED